MTEEPYQFESEIELTVEESKFINFDDISEFSDYIIYVPTEEGIQSIDFEGRFSLGFGYLIASVELNWYRKYWDLPMGLLPHMDLMKRLVEFRAEEFEDIEQIELKDEGDWCHLNFNIKLKSKTTLFEAYEEAKGVMNWINYHLEEAQANVGCLINKISEKYSKLKLVELPRLIEKLNTLNQKNGDANEKGKILEELSVRFFSSIDGLQIIERTRTKTEEIDLVILNKSDESFWKSESNLVLVECKNWTKKKAGKNEYVSFREKLINRKGRAKLGFFISGIGFAKTFHQEDLRNSKDDFLIVTIAMKEMIKTLLEQRDVNEFLEKKYIEASNK